MKKQTNASSRGQVTREALVVAATEVFARDGFHAASLRDIALAAGINQALIGYHFRNKEGLYLAVFEHMVEQILLRIGPLADTIDAALKAPENTQDRQARIDLYLPLLLRLTDGLLALMASYESDNWGQLILREQQAPTAAFSVFYEGLMRRVVMLLTQMVRRLREDDSEADARLLVATILGQVLVFRAARAGILRLMQWERIGADELDLIRVRIHRTVRALLETGD
jgi:AcrR family transcriptional regulator